MLYIFAIGSIATYGTVLAGWASNNNWSLLGSLRVSAQMISYEVTMGLSVVGVFMVFRRCKLTDMARRAGHDLPAASASSSTSASSRASAGSTGCRCPTWGIFSSRSAS